MIPAQARGWIFDITLREMAMAEIIRRRGRVAPAKDWTALICSMIIMIMAE